jgi:hypothetical protein
VVLHFHFGMSGAFRTAALPGPPPTATTRLRLVNIQLGIVAHLSAMTVQHGPPSMYLEKIAKLGPDPLRYAPPSRSSSTAQHLIVISSMLACTPPPQAHQPTALPHSMPRPTAAAVPNCTRERPELLDNFLLVCYQLWK